MEAETMMRGERKSYLGTLGIPDPDCRAQLRFRRCPVTMARFTSVWLCLHVYETNPQKIPSKFPQFPSRSPASDGLADC